MGVMNHCMTPGLVLAALMGIVVPRSERAGGEPYDTSGWVGANYTPAFCTNAVQLWHEFRPEVIERELAAAREHFGITSLRVYLHDIPYRADRESFLSNIERFLGICARHEIRPGFVFFDDCWNHEGVTLESRPPIKGRHNGRWAACPQNVERTEERLPELKAYVQDVIRAHREDERVLWWEIFNEPRMDSPYSVELRKLGYRWAKELDPHQPVLCCWNDSPETDVVDAHNYGNDFAAWDAQADMNPDKGTVFTEAGARWFAPWPSNGEPLEGNLLRVAAEGPRIRVWLNRMHPSADEDRGLRIDYADAQAPVLSGNVGVRAHRTEAWFDNVVVLPIDALPR